MQAYINKITVVTIYLDRNQVFIVKPHKTPEA